MTNTGRFLQRAILTLLISHCPLIICHAYDIGLVLDQNADYGGYGNDSSGSYSASLIPRFFTLLNDKGEIYISAGLNAAYHDEWAFIPELLRTEFTYHSGYVEFKAGRMHFGDPLGFVSEGLFDGAGFSFDTEAGAFSAGAWYTGLLYKKRANITMTDAEAGAYAVEVDLKDPGTYFAGKRLIAALGWERLSLGGRLQAWASLIAQFDLADEGKLNSQYAIGKVFWPGTVFDFALGACFEMIQTDNDSFMAMAGELKFSLTPQALLAQKLTFTGRYSTGFGDMGFAPITTKNQGEIFKAGISGLSTVSLDYMARLMPAVALGLTSTYFLRSDLDTDFAYPQTGDKGYGLGNEFFGRLLWNPASDLQVNIGAGVFMSSLGNAAPKAENLWRIEANVVISL